MTETEALLGNYSPLDSDTLLQLPTCVADRKTKHLIVCAAGEVSPEDWQTVMDRFPIRTPEYDFDYSIIDGTHYYRLTEIDE